MTNLIIKKIDPTRRVQAVAIYRELTGKDLAETVNIFKSLPVIIPNMDDDAAAEVGKALSKAGCAVELENERARSRASHLNPLHTKYSCQICGNIWEGMNPPDEYPVCHAASDQFQKLGSSEQTGGSYQTSRVTNAAEFATDGSSMSIPSDISHSSRDEIIPVLEEIDALSQEWYQLPIEKQMKENLIAGYKKQYDEIRNRVTTATKVICVLLSLLLCIPIVVPGILFFLIARPLIYRSNRKKHSEENEREAERFYQQQIVPEEKAIEEIEERMEFLETSGQIDRALDIVGEEIFLSREVGELISLISSHRADNLKEALNLYDSSQHRSRMEEMQSAIQNATEVSAIESAKQTAISKQIEKNSHRAATAATSAAMHARSIDRKTPNYDRRRR